MHGRTCNKMWFCQLAYVRGRAMRARSKISRIDVGIGRCLMALELVISVLYQPMFKKAITVT